MSYDDEVRARIDAAVGYLNVKGVEDAIPVHSLKTEDGTFVQVELGPLYHTLTCMNAERGNVDDNTPEGDPGEDSSCICRVGLRSWVEIEEAPE